jgi:hypothetical protein
MAAAVKARFQLLRCHEKLGFLSVIICSPNISISVSCRCAKVLQCKMMQNFSLLNIAHSSNSSPSYLLSSALSLSSFFWLYQQNPTSSPSASLSSMVLLFSSILFSQTLVCSCWSPLFLHYLVFFRWSPLRFPFSYVVFC